jgi:D-3-phosphoglycerate dehydrogenase / 2-oxoglutarate reductase
MIKILANDGIHPDGRLLLEEAGYYVTEDKIAQDQLVSKIGEYDVLIVRSATQVTRDIIDAGKKLKIIARGGVGMDNIDVDYARSKGLQVFNTPMASSRAVAELAMGHMYGISRMLHRSNRMMASGGDFKKLKKEYEAGVQLRGKTLGIIGFGRIGQELAKIAIGTGLNVVAYDPYVQEAELSLQFNQISSDLAISIKIRTVDLDSVLRQSDYISMHSPGSKEPIIGAAQMSKLKDGVILVNAARGGVIDETALLEALNSGKVAGVGLDVFLNEPTPNEALLKHPSVSCTPHIGASTVEAQSYIGMELAEKVIGFFGDDK